jgi:hypothetical protein
MSKMQQKATKYFKKNEVDMSSPALFLSTLKVEATHMGCVGALRKFSKCGWVDLSCFICEAYGVIRVWSDQLAADGEGKKKGKKTHRHCKYQDDTQALHALEAALRSEPTGVDLYSELAPRMAEGCGDYFDEGHGKGFKFFSGGPLARHWIQRRGSSTLSTLANHGPWHHREKLQAVLDCMRSSWLLWGKSSWLQAGFINSVSSQLDRLIADSSRAAVTPECAYQSAEEVGELQV